MHNLTTEIETKNLVYAPSTPSGQQTDQAYSPAPRTCMGLK